MKTTQQALVLGATGNIGGEIARRLVENGWQVRALQRNPTQLVNPDTRFEWIKGDAMRREDVLAAAANVDLIVHAVNPAGYHNWAGLVLPMLDNSIAAARASGARILLPGTVYNFGPDAFPLIDEDAPQHPRTRKGAIRVEMERRLQEASRDGVRSLIVRAGDYFGPGSGNSWFSGAMIKPHKPLRSLLYPGRRHVGHQWAYIPDVAETMLRLLALDRSLPTFARYHMRGHWDADGARMIESIRRVTNRPVKVRRFPWWVLPMASPFSELFRELREMRYLWQRSVQLDNGRLTDLLGEEPHTPWDQAVSATLNSLGVVDERSVPAEASGLV